MLQNQYGEKVSRLRVIAPDISDQESSEQAHFNDYWELKRRLLHAFQCSLMLKALDTCGPASLTVADIGDSAGTHMLYLKELAKEGHTIDTLSVNLDPRAVDKVTARGLRAILCRAELVDLSTEDIDIATSFEMIEHLHNPALFFRNLATKSRCKKLVVTMPYVRSSRVGLHRLRHRYDGPVYAEDEHIFELNPGDWRLLAQHAGWKVVYSGTYYQYPRRWPFVSNLFAFFWRKTDFEGFWGAILERDPTFSDRYQDWEG